MGYRAKRLRDLGRGMRESKVMLERERWPRERIEAFQQARLAALTAHAAERSGLWRKRLPEGPVRLLVTADPDVREFQVVQRGDALRLRVALRDGADDAPARLRARLGARLEELGVQRPAVEVETVEELERSAGGKLQMIVATRT